jgi:hypothetical protein
LKELKKKIREKPFRQICKRVGLINTMSASLKTLIKLIVDKFNNGKTEKSNK